MEISPFLHPSVLITVFLSIVGYVVWQVRLESKISSNTTATEALKNEVEKLEKQVADHEKDNDIHFNIHVSRQVEQGNDRRFAHIEKQLSDISTKIDKLTERK